MLDYAYALPLTSLAIRIIKKMKLFILSVACIILSNCAFYPKKVELYDQDCNLKYKQLELKSSTRDIISGQCNNEGCIANLLTIPIQALIAGSIVIVGNTIFWLEKEAHCLLNDNNS